MNFQRLQQTVSAVYSFFLALTLYPEVARKAQAEIDAVVGSDRLPTFVDRPYLPYINALTMEVFRWNTVVPTGTPCCCFFRNPAPRTLSI
jgi:cytochrome P450